MYDDDNEREPGDTSIDVRLCFSPDSAASIQIKQISPSHSLQFVRDRVFEHRSAQRTRDPLRNSLRKQL